MLQYNSVIKRIENIPEIQSDIIGKIEGGYPVYLLSYGDGKKRVILSAGIHGDEPAGVEAILRFIEDIRGKAKKGIRKWEREYQFVILPCTNPTGYESGTRENILGIDLNRNFGSKNPPEEVAIIQNALKRGRFDLYMDFHEDTDGEGFYLYEVLGNGGNHLAEEVIKKISRKYPVDLRERIDGFPNCGGVICPQREKKKFPLKRSNLPLPLYLYLHGVRRCFTIESPTFLSMEKRVGMHLMALDVILSQYALL